MASAPGPRGRVHTVSHWDSPQRAGSCTPHRNAGTEGLDQAAPSRSYTRPCSLNAGENANDKTHLRDTPWPSLSVFSAKMCLHVSGKGGPWRR